jgi:hypothetical protein
MKLNIYKLSSILLLLLFAQQLSAAPRTPAAPTNLTAAPAPGGNVNLSWVVNSTNEDGFGVEVRKYNEQQFRAAGRTQRGAHNFQVGNLMPGMLYYFRVYAFNRSGNSPFSNIVNLITPADSHNVNIAAPTDLFIEVLSYTTVKLTWRDNSINEEGFKIELRKTGEPMFRGVGEAHRDSTSYTVNCLQPNIKFYFRVFAFAMNRNSGFSNTDSIITNQVPAAPSGLTALNVTPSRVLLAWNDNSSNEDGFIIERRTNNESWIIIDTLGTDILTYQDVGLESATQYIYHIYAYNDAGNSGTSNDVIVQTASDARDRSTVTGIYPNPFNPASVIQYRTTDDGIVKLTIYDISGREISSLVNKFQQRGSYSVTFDGTALASGVYYCRLITGSSIDIRKLMLIK